LIHGGPPTIELIVYTLTNKENESKEHKKRVNLQNGEKHGLNKM
jgi:hypothetical protein